MRVFPRAICVVFLGAPAAAEAHHSNAIFDTEAKLTIEGTIVDYEWVNPHVYLWVETVAEDGEAQTWEVEGQPPALLRRLGWTPDTVAIGDTIAVTGNRHRDRDVTELLLDTIERTGSGAVPATNEEAFLGALMAPPGDPVPADGFSGVWETQFDLEVLAPTFSAETIALTPRGQAAVDSFIEGVDSPAIDCVAYPAPTMMIVPDIKSIEMRDDAVIIRGEFDTAERTIWLDTQSHDGAAPRNHGHSIGRIDGDVLVIDTQMFAPHRSALAEGVPSGLQKRLTERLELSEDRTHITYSYELEDPEYLAEPIVIEGIRWWHRPDLDFVALPCSRENARRFAD